VLELFECGDVVVVVVLLEWIVEVEFGLVSGWEVLG